MNRSIKFCLFAFACANWHLSARAAQIWPAITLAATNLAPPGTVGVVYDQFEFGSGTDGDSNAPAINALGEATFLSTLKGIGVTDANKFVLWSSGGGALHAVARTGNQAPGMPAGVSFAGFTPPRDGNISPTGETTFVATLIGPGVDSTNDTGIWMEKNGLLQLIARTGSQAATLPAGINYAGFITDPLVTSNGRLAFTAALAGPGLTVNNDSGLFVDTGSGLFALAREGNQAHNLPSGVVYGNFGFQGLSLGGNANVAFHAHLKGTGVNTSNDFGIWTQTSPANVSLVAREGDAAPGAPAGSVWRTSGPSDPFNTPVVNSAGQVAFLSTVLVGSQIRLGAWTNVGGAVNLVALEGQAVPGLPGISVTSLSNPFGDSPLVMNHNGDIALRAQITGSLDAILAWHAGAPAVVAREGDPAPGLAALTYRDIAGEMILNSSGHVAFYGHVNGPGVVLDQNSGAIWAQDRGGLMRMIVRQGDQLEVSAGVFRTIDYLVLLAGAGNDDGRPNGFNDAGQVAFFAGFTDGTQGLFLSSIATVPEPSSLELGLVGFVLAAIMLQKNRRARSL